MLECDAIRCADGRVVNVIAITWAGAGSLIVELKIEHNYSN